MLVRVGDRDIQIPKSTVLSLLGVYIDQGPAGRDRKAFLEKVAEASITGWPARRSPVCAAPRVARATCACSARCSPATAVPRTLAPRS